MAGGEERPGGGGDDKKQYPVGFRFQPTDRELVEFYLLPKLLDQPTVPNDAVIEADAYECDPEILTKKYEDRSADDNWFFLSPRSRRYPGGDRPTRRTADNRGRWKPSTGQSKPGKNAAAGHSKGKKGKSLSAGTSEYTENTLAYYVGEPKDETKTKWLMHELTIPEPQKEKDPSGAIGGEKPRDHMLLNKYVMCNIYKSPLRKWKEAEDEAGCSTSSAPALDEEMPLPTSSQSWSAPPESAGEASTATPSSKRAGKRPTLGQPSGHAGAPNKRASHQMMNMPPGQPVPPAHANSGMRPPPPVGAAGGYYHGVPGLPPLMQWPPAMYSGMQGPVQLQQRPPPMMYGHNVQGPPVLKLHPSHRVAATATGPRGPTMMMHPASQVARQPVREPSFPQQPQQQQQLMPNMTPDLQRVLMQLAAEMKLQRAQQESASCAGQQQATPTQAAWFDEGASHSAAAAATSGGLVPYPQFRPASHNLYPCSDVQLQQHHHHHQQQQCSSAIFPAATSVVPPGAAAPVEASPAADNAPTKVREVPCEEMQSKEAGTGTATTIASN